MCQQHGGWIRNWRLQVQSGTELVFNALSQSSDDEQQADGWQTDCHISRLLGSGMQDLGFGIPRHATPKAQMKAQEGGTKCRGIVGVENLSGTVEARSNTLRHHGTARNGQPNCGIAWAHGSVEGVHQWIIEAGQRSQLSGSQPATGIFPSHAAGAFWSGPEVSTIPPSCNPLVLLFCRMLGFTCLSQI